MKLDYINVDEYKKTIYESNNLDKDLLFQYMDRLVLNGMPIIFDIEHLATLLNVEYKQLLGYIFATNKAYHLDSRKRDEDTTSRIAANP